MLRANRTSRGNRRSRRNAATRTNANISRKQLRGHELRVSPMPPEFTSRPWFNITVAVGALPGTQLTSTQLFAALAAQIGLTSPLEIQRLEMRLYTVRVWGPLVANNAGTTLQPIELSILDPLAPNQSATGASTRTLEEFTRYPDQVNRASIGYRYPIAQSDLVLQQPGIVLLLAYNAAATNGLAIFTISFRFDVFVNPPTGILSRLLN